MLRKNSINKLIFLLTAMLMLIVVACSPTEPNANASNSDSNTAVLDPNKEDAAAPNTINTETVNTNSSDAAAYGDLPALPAMGATDGDMAVSEEAAVPVASAPGMGMGGGTDAAYGRGGGGGYGGFGYYGGLPFVDTNFVLQTELPGTPTAANVWQTPGTINLTVEEARAIAQRFGFAGELYIDYYSVNMPTPVPADSPEADARSSEMYQAPTVYYAFNDTHMLSIYGTDVSYSTLSTTMSYGPLEMMPYEEALPLVEAFLNERGLLTFDYVAQKNYWGQDVQIYRLLDGYRSMNPDFTVTVNKSGEIAYMYYSRLNEMGTATEYPLITAAAAWELLQQGVDYTRVFYNIYPQLDENGQPIPVEAAMGMTSVPNSYYQRQYQNGESIELYPYLMAYLPAGGDGTPRIQGDQFRFLASDEVLKEMVNYVGQQIHATGTVIEIAPGIVAVQVESWEPTTEYPEYRYEAGVIERSENGEVIFRADVGLTWILPNAPAEIEDGERVFVNGWLPPGIAQSDPQVFNWQTIEKMQAGIPGVSEITITSVDLVYSVNYGGSVFQDGVEMSINYLQPAWRFSGATNQGEQIEIMVQAVDPTYITQ